MTSRALTGLNAVVWAVLLVACGGGSSPTSPTAAAVPAPAPTTSTPPSTPVANTAPTSVRVECSSSVARTETTTCRAVAVTPTLLAERDRHHRMLDTDVTGLATWSSSNQSVATVSRGQVEGVTVGSASIEAIFQGTPGRAIVEVKKNEIDLIDGVAGRYSAAGSLQSNTCAGTSPLTAFAGEIVIDQLGVRTRNLQLSYEGRVQRVFRTNFVASSATGELRFESDPLLTPFGAASSIRSTKVTATANSSGQITTVREEMSCGTGAIVFNIDTLKLF